MIKNAKEAGADNLTPSIPQYFSWINNTNEGSTEEQTLINLDFFEYMEKTYGMQIGIYAWDAGNFDGALLGYGDLNGEKFRSQYPEGYKNVVAKAKSLGIKMGLWGSPDGFGDDAETEKKRYDFFVHLCRDYNFGLFKLDGVCGPLRPEKGKLFSDMLVECRNYVPSLIVLNHRLNLYEAEKNVTTYLWNGEETYTDVFAHNKGTCMHHRGYLFTRGLTDNLERLAEDHGVCISSCIDYFEDDLVYQAFGRCLILSPEIYGNPWLMKDSEFKKLARIYNLHRRYAKILVNGMKLPKSYGPNAVSRGNGEIRIICTGNNSWNKTTVSVKLNDEIGLEKRDKFAVTVLFPYVKKIGEFAYGEEVNVDLMPFRASLIEISVPEKTTPVVVNAEYEPVIERDDGTAVEYIIKTEENTARAPIFLGSLKNKDEKANKELLYEASVFAADNDALEYRSLVRSGETEIPQVKKCRDAFFGQKLYKLRGTENRNLFDGRDDTFFDSETKTYSADEMRIKGGCLRIDFGEIIDADTIELDCFFTDKETKEVIFNTYPDFASVSENLADWKISGKAEITGEKSKTETVVTFKVHSTYELDGKIKTISYPVKGKIRYMRIPCPPDRIYNIRVIKNGKTVKLTNPKANNMFAPFESFEAEKVLSGEIILPENKRNGSYLAVAIEGKCGNENAYVALEKSGRFYGCPDRAPSYRSNVWEHVVCCDDGYYTYYFPVDDFDGGDKLNVYAVFGKTEEECEVNVYLCENKSIIEG